MNDNLEELRRIWITQDCLDSGVKYLNQRVRIGNLDLDCLEASACLGSKAAQTVLEGPTDPDCFLDCWWLGEDYRQYDAPRWSRVYQRLGPEALFRLGLALAWAHIYETPDELAAAQFLNKIEAELETCIPKARSVDFGLGRVAFFLWPFSSLTPIHLRTPNRIYWHITCPPEVAIESMHTRIVPWLLR